MARFRGTVGFSESVETKPGVWTNQTIEKEYTGDVLQNIRRWEDGERANGNFVMNNRISILADTYTYLNIPNIRYVIWLGVKWKVTAAEVKRPRILLNLGEVYNGP